jgi:hypothetical protein
MYNYRSNIDRDRQRMTRQSEANFSGQIGSMTATIQRLHARLEQKIEECKNETAESGMLLKRAQRLNERLELLKEKLRVSFQMTGEDQPENLQITLQQMANVDPDGAPHEFVCPITQCLMVDPVSTCDNQVYDRCAIVEWFASFSGGRKPRSPLTNLPLDNLTLTPQPELARKIQVYLKEQCGVGKNSAAASSGVATVEEPSLRQLPLDLIRSGNLSAGAPTQPPPQATAARSSGPIWSSSVVPASEENSRVLNLLRVDDSLPLPTEMNPAVPSAHPPRMTIAGRLPPAGIVGHLLPPRRVGAGEAGGSRVRPTGVYRSASAVNPSRTVAQRAPETEITRSDPNATPASSAVPPTSEVRRTKASEVKSVDTRTSALYRNPAVVAGHPAPPASLVVPPALRHVAHRVRSQLPREAPTLDPPSQPEPNPQPTSSAARGSAVHAAVNLNSRQKKLPGRPPFGK